MEKKPEIEPILIPKTNRVSFSFDRYNVAVPQLDTSDIFTRFDESIKLYYQDSLISELIDFLVNLTITSLTPASFSNETLKTIFADPMFRISLFDIALSFFALNNVCLIYTFTGKNNMYIPQITVVPMSKVMILGPTTDPIYGIEYDSKTVRAFKNNDTERIKQLGLNTFIERAAEDADYDVILDEEYRRMVKAKKNSTLIVKKDNIMFFRKNSFGRYAEPLLYKIKPAVEVKNYILSAKSSFYAAASLFVFLVSMKDASEAELVNFMSDFRENAAKTNVFSLGSNKETTIDVISGWDKATGKDVAREDLVYIIDTIVKQILGVAYYKTFDDLMAAISIKVNSFIPVMNGLIEIIAEKNGIEPEPVHNITFALSETQFNNLIKAKELGLISASSILNAMNMDPDRELAFRSRELENRYDEKMMPRFQPYQGIVEPPGGEADEG